MVALVFDLNRMLNAIMEYIHFMVSNIILFSFQLAY